MIGLTNSKNYEDIADAIRSKGVSGYFTPGEMAAAIGEIGGGSDVLLKYTSDMGYISSGGVVSNEISNLLALAYTAGKDLQIRCKKGSASYDDWTGHFYFGSDYMRFGISVPRATFEIKVGGGTTQRISADLSKEIIIRFNHSDKSVDLIQDGAVVSNLPYWSEDLRPYTVVSGTTAIFANENWLEYLIIEMT